MNIFPKIREATLTCQIYKVHGTAFLGLATLRLDDLVEDDGDHCVGAAAGRIHVG